MANIPFPKREEEILEFWDKNHVFEKSLQKPSPKGEFVFYDGPPFATGLPHYGHILASTIKDVIPRYKTMRGYHVRRRWGWDCHGLPIENIVEQKLGISGKKQIEERGIAEFNRACREGVLAYAAEWGKMVRRIGRFVEFENSYKTMDSTYMESVWWALKQIWDKKLIYEGRKVLLYCPRCETPISNFEVAMDNSYEEVTEEAVIVKFLIHLISNSPNQIPNNAPVYMLAWTTTPWTLPGNVALAVGEEIDYVMVRTPSPAPTTVGAPSPARGEGDRFDSSPLMGEDKGGGEYLILAKSRLAILTEPYEVVQEMKGKDLVGLEYAPLFKVEGLSLRARKDSPSRRAFKVYPADFVTTEEGTGIVHTAVVYGEDDYNLGLKYKLPVVPLLDEKGVFNEKSPELISGQYFKDSENTIKKDLEARGLMYKREKYTHSYPFCWRCDTQLFYNAIPAWFVKISKLKKKLLKLNEKINWYPEHLKHGRFKNGLENAPDWNISRNRYWATPLPFWRCVVHNPPQPSLTLREGENLSPPLKIRGGAGGVMNGGCGNVVCIGSFQELKQRATNYDEVYKSHDLKDIDLHRPYIDEVKIKCDKCDSEMRRIPEVVDCWVESASMPFAEFHFPFENQEEFKRRYPADFVAEYIAQTRAWFYVMHVIGSAIFGKPPFKNVVTTGTILAEDGSKMSKSKQNFPDPWDLINRYGVDALRFHLMTSVVMQADNLNFSEREVDGIYKKVVLLTQNVLSFYKLYAPPLTPPPQGGETNQFPPLPEGISSPARGEARRGGSGGVGDVPSNSRHILDRWIIARLHETIRDMTEGLDRYDVVRAGRLIPEFVNNLSTWYLRRSRERFKSSKKSERESALRTTSYILHTFSQLLAPFMPFLAEHVWQEVTSYELRVTSYSVHLADWPKVKKSKIDTALLEEMRVARKIVELTHAARAEAKIKVRQPLEELKIQNVKLKMSEELLRLIAEEVNVKEVKIVPSPQSSPTGGEEVIGNPSPRSTAGRGQGEGGWVTKTDGTLTISLNTAITPELQKEGLARELTRHINEVRKIVGLTPQDTVHVMVAVIAPSPPTPLPQGEGRVREVVKDFQKQLRKSVIAASVKVVNAPQEVDWSHEVELENHEKLWVGMRRG
ncbi:hypothetical protein A3B21_01195 [Candidatus Uhrbacteria bacterium RIFCSPLOWO2_01_FULL_47_24]|uniref:Isoleucine--tRNA ligase n=1 Tax=Candidatus Uhrbacteria bacterium RIFCSPLOWO2_01_FULL_47_24 TaxID=1802401 RepID=A0A1F7URV0_9BACT|nr:MAG: hypothetical protein A2753_03475 [Candidatus Uhrbacteria bacterium RIFCSPHIGHO2_01_FULL_47_11]OGL67719.1 MAG: hypothetical protein A3D58_00955 [Candidatus Uhrbacteria bacterium RIFCSPHIGHO2_02_FULL_46_47]OGL75661.1 MAG: hypothetical protein A3F52_04650 [Candidatus Uhrbacteria bacterium RIFCSPHIGHO2_12_FULL_47_11]OGL81010.1 MAG: hypothetical protein A3B21_01195 [Candidatus Uhrbacteria bacterium RIFCSPLOWO2_01_FULL_47_24]OGL84311.1 MAG: hypothetical protein A3J03_00255 [Candidatus Uhrbact